MKTRICLCAPVRTWSCWFSWFQCAVAHVWPSTPDISNGRAGETNHHLLSLSLEMKVVMGLVIVATSIKHLYVRFRNGRRTTPGLHVLACLSDFIGTYRQVGKNSRGGSSSTLRLIAKPDYCCYRLNNVTTPEFGFSVLQQCFWIFVGRVSGTSCEQNDNGW